MKADPLKLDSRFNHSERSAFSSRDSCCVLIHLSYHISTAFRLVLQICHSFHSVSFYIFRKTHRVFLRSIKNNCADNRRVQVYYGSARCTWPSTGTSLGLWCARSLAYLNKFNRLATNVHNQLCSWHYIISTNMGRKRKIGCERNTYIAWFTA